MIIKRFVLCFLILLVLAGQSVYANELGFEEIYNENLNRIQDSVDDESKELIDKADLESEKFTDIGIGFINGFIKKALTVLLSNILKLCAVVVVCGLVSKFTEFAGGKISPDILKLLEIFFVTLVCYTLIDGMFRMVDEYSKNMNSLMTSYGVVMTEIYLFSGNITKAAASSAWLAFALEISRKLCIGVLIPVIKICYSVSLASSISLSEHLKAVSSFFKNIFVWLSGFFMTVLTVIMSFQTTFAGAKDSIALRSVKFAASNTIPIIGGLVSESLRTLSTATTLMKSQSGLICIICIIAVSITPLAYVFGIKYTFSFGESFAGFLGVESVKSVLSDCSKLVNYLIAIIVITGIYYIYFVSVFIKSAGALGG